MGNSTAAVEGNHWLLQQGKLMIGRLPRGIELCKLECESWIVSMTDDDIDNVLNDLQKIESLFDERMQNIQYLESNNRYYIEILPPALYPESADESALPRAEDIPFSVKIYAMAPRLKELVLTRNHFQIAAYKMIVHVSEDWSLMKDTSKVEFMADISGLLALASNADIAANGTMSFSELNEHFIAKRRRECAMKSKHSPSNQQIRERKAQLIKDYEASGLSRNSFADANYAHYGLEHDTVRTYLQNGKIKKFKENNKDLFID